VNPLARTQEVYRLAEGRWLLVATHEATARVRAEPFEAVELALGPLWGEADHLQASPVLPTGASSPTPK